MLFDKILCLEQFCASSAAEFALVLDFDVGCAQLVESSAERGNVRQFNHPSVRKSRGK